MSKIKSGKYKEWEKDRRNRLNAAFDTLAKLLPKYDPSAPFSKIEILQKSIEYIEELQKKYKELIAGNDKMLFNHNEELEENLALLRSRNSQLSELLRKAGITIPSKNTFSGLKTINTNKENETTAAEQPETAKTEENNFNQINIKPIGRPKKYENIITSEQIAALTENVKKLTEDLEKDTANKLPKKKPTKNVKISKTKQKTDPVVKKENTSLDNKSKIEKTLLENEKAEDKIENKEEKAPSDDISKIDKVDDKSDNIVETLASVASLINIPQNENTCLLMSNNKILGTLQRASIISPNDVTATYTSLSTPIMATGVFLPNGNIIPMSALQSQTAVPGQTTSLFIVNNNNNNKTINVSKTLITNKFKTKLNKINIKSRTPNIIKSKMIPGKLPIPKLKRNILLTRKTIRNKINHNKTTKKVIKEKLMVNDKKRKLINGNKGLVKKCKKINEKKIVNNVKGEEKLPAVEEAVVVNICDKLDVAEGEKTKEENKDVNKFQPENSSNSSNGNSNEDAEQTNDYLNNSVNKLDIHEDTHNTLSLTLPHSDLSNDLFESLQVPQNSSHQESLSPTAAFLLTFPLVSSGGKVTEVGINDENLTENNTSPSNLLQIGQIDTTQHINHPRNVDDIDKTIDTNNLNENSNNLLLENLSSLFNNNNNNNDRNPCKSIEKRINYDTTEKGLNSFTSYENNNNNNFNYLNTVKLSNNNNNNKESLEGTTTITEATAVNHSIFTNNNNNNNFIDEKNYSLKSCNNNLNDNTTKYSYSTINDKTINNNSNNNNNPFIESSYKHTNNHHQILDDLKENANNNFIQPEFTFTLTSFSTTATTVTSSLSSTAGGGVCVTSIEPSLPYKSSANAYSSILPNMNTRTTATTTVIPPTSSINNTDIDHNNKFYYGKTSSFNETTNYHHPHYVYNTPPTSLQAQNGFSFSLINTTTAASSMDTTNSSLNLPLITTQSPMDKYNAKDFKTQFSFNFSPAPPYMACTTTPSSATLTSSIATTSSSAAVPPTLPMSMTDVTYSNLTPNYNSYTPYAFDANLSNFSAENFHTKVSGSTTQNDTMNFTFALTSTTKSQAKYTSSSTTAVATTASLPSTYSHSAYNPFSIDATLNSMPTTRSDATTTKQRNVENKINSSCLVDSMRVSHVPMHIPMPCDNNPMLKSSYDYCSDFSSKVHTTVENVTKKENQNSISAIINNNNNNSINMDLRTPTKKLYPHNADTANKYDSRVMMNLPVPSSASVVHQKTPTKIKNTTTTTAAMCQLSKYSHVSWMSSPEFKQTSQNDNYPILPPLEFGQNAMHSNSFYPTSHVTSGAPSQSSLRNIELNRKPSDIFFAHPPGDDNFSWSPSKISNTVEAPPILSGHSYLPTLPTLHGDLALNPMTCNTNNFMAPSFEDKKIIIKDKSPLNHNKTGQYHNNLVASTNNVGNTRNETTNIHNNNNNPCNNSGSLFSVSQLVNQEQNVKNNYQQQVISSQQQQQQQPSKPIKISNKINQTGISNNNKIKQKLKFDDINVNKRDSIKTNINDKRSGSGSGSGTYPLITSPIINHHHLHHHNQYNNEAPNIFIDSYNNSYGNSEQHCSSTLILPPTQHHQHQLPNQQQQLQQQPQLQQQHTNKTNIYSAESLISNKKDKNNISNKFYNHHIDMYSSSNNNNINNNNNNDNINTSDILPTLYNPHYHHPTTSAIDFNNMENNFTSNFLYNSTSIIPTTVVTTNTLTIITTTATTTGVTPAKVSSTAVSTTVLPTNYTFQQNCVPLTDDYNAMCYPMDIIGNNNNNNDVKGNKIIGQNLQQQQQQSNLYRSDDINVVGTSATAQLNNNNNDIKNMNNNSRLQSQQNLISRSNSNKKPTSVAVTTTSASAVVTTTTSWKQHDNYSLPSSIHHHSHVPPSALPTVSSVQHNHQQHNHQQHHQQQHHHPSNFDTNLTSNYFPVPLTKNPPIVTSVPPPLPATGISTTTNSTSLMDDNPFYSLHSFNYSNNMKNYPPPPPNHLSTQHHHNHYPHQYHHNHSTHNHQLSTLSTNLNPLPPLSSSSQSIISSLALPSTTTSSMPSNNHLQNSTNSLTNFNLSTICPEINDKVRQQNW